ncbi:hypothetical protein BCV69DRAFT_299074 [Microstroma glucosiphilum]|uniref:Uncharacterized protein n=1 Tax=Pseudomicrostroma glucosiphilum TaxID=1684307 RepID=A0A316U5V4_9BASI|nr:hypothetical protein BCV69DRAFT_299074 [Pseudomicrostroma glucosiphilum]PWN20592.1 hypothetical protein BCV69DRAFT_299074 [Pseudomicrostroma glucosiphilum]
MAAEVSSPHSSRPGSDASNPHQDLYIPPSRLSLSLASDPRRPGNDPSTSSGTNGTGNASNPSPYTPLFGSVEFWTRREQADVERGAPLQAASIHRAAEVARWEWIQAHRTRLEREKRDDPIQTQPSRAGYSFLPSFSTSYSNSSYSGGRSMPWRQAVAAPREPPVASSSSSPPSSMEVTASGPVTHPRYNAQASLTEGPTLPRPYIDESSVISGSEMSSLEDRLQREDIVSTRGQTNAHFQSPLQDSTTAFGSRQSNETSQANQTSDFLPSLRRTSLQRHRDQRPLMPREAQSSRFLASGGTLHDDLTAWNHLCRDLAIAAGISPDEDGPGEEEARVASTSSRSMLPFGIEAGPRGLPHPIWGRRYLGPAGTWLRAELLARGREAAGLRSSDGVTPASALANEWRATVRNARTAVGGGSGVAASRPADRTTGGPSATSSADRTSGDSAEAGAPTVPRHPTSVVGTPNVNDSLGLPAVTLDGSLTDPWAASLARNNESLRPPPTLISPTPPLTAPIGSGRPPHSVQPTHPSQTPAMRSSGNDPLPDSAFHVPAAAASPPQRTAAAEEVARLARSARALRENLRNSRQPRRLGVGESSPSSSVSTDIATSPAATTTHGQRISDGNGMRLLRRLRALDGLEDRRTDRSETNSANVAEVFPFDSAPRPHELFPWYSPPSRGQELPSTSNSRSQSDFNDATANPTDDPANLDPDGDAVGQDWYRGVRARMQGSLAAAAAQAARDDPDGERVPREVIVSGDEDISTRHRSGRRSRGRGEDAEVDDEGAARRQRNRTALVIADGDDTTSSSNPWLASATTTAPRNVAEGWTLVSSSGQSPPSPPMPQSPVRATRDEGSDNVTMWFRGPSGNRGLSTSPSSTEEPRTDAVTLRTEGMMPRSIRSPLRPISAETSQPSTAEIQAASDPRTVRRPQRLRSLNEDDLVLASGNLAAQDAARPSRMHQQVAAIGNEPRPIPTWSSLARRAEYWGAGQPSSTNTDANPSALQAISSAPNLSVFDLHRDVPIDELRSRQLAIWHASQAEHVNRRSSGDGILADVMTDEPEEATPQELSNPVDQDSTTSPMHRSSSAVAAVQDRMADVSSRLEAELREREEELRASAERLTEELARRRARIDELRQREGRIGRVLESSEAALRRVQDMQSSAGQTGDAINSRTEHTTVSPAATPADMLSAGQRPPAEPVSQTRPQTLANSSLVRRRTLRDSAPQLRGPRAPRGGFNYLERTVETSRETPPAAESRTAFAPLMRRSASSSSLALSTSSTGREKDEDQNRSTLQSPGPTSSRRCLDDSILASPLAAQALLLSHPPLRSLITAEDQRRLDATSALIVEAMDSAGHSAYRDAVLSAHRRRLENWSPAQIPLSSTTMESSYPLRFEISRHMRSDEPSDQGSMPATTLARMRNVLRNDESSVSFDASRGTEVVLRFLAAMPQSGASRDPAPSSSHLTTTRTPLMASLTAQDGGVSPLSGPSMSRLEEEQAWNTARARLMTGSSNPVTPPSMGDVTESTLPAPEAATQAASSSPLASPPAGRSVAGSVPANMPQIPRGLTDRETSVIRHILALRGTASTVAERVSQLSRLSNDDISVIRGLAIRAALPPGFFAVQSQSSAATPRVGGLGDVAAGNGAVNVTPSASGTDPVPPRLARSELPSLLFTEPVPLTEEQLALVKELCVQVCPDDDARPTASAQVLSLVAKDKVDRFIALRAQSFAQAATHKASAEGPDSQGPVFALSSLIVKAREAPSPLQGPDQGGDVGRANESGAGSGSAIPAHASSTSPQQSTSRPPLQSSTSPSVDAARREPRNHIHALIFFSISPITREQLAEWDNVHKTDAIRYLRTLRRERSSRHHEEDRGSRSRLEPWELDPLKDSEQEERDLGDPTAVARRREEMHRADDAGVQRLLDAREAAGGSTSDSRSLPQLRPAAIFPIDLTRGGAIVNLEQEGLRTHGDAQQRRQRPIGRYMAIKILAGDGPVGSAARRGDADDNTAVSSAPGSEAAAATRRCIDLFYIGVRGWPATGTGSQDGRWRD